jgi:hypothetical protein
VRIVFTKCHEEVTSVKKSVMRFTVETSEKYLDIERSPVIELSPEVPAAHQTTTAASSRRLPSLSALAEKVSDIVDLHNLSRKDKPSQVTYTMVAARRRNLLREGYGGENTLQPECERIDKNRKALPEREGTSPMPINKNLSVRRFMNVQEMTEDSNRRENKLTIEINA